MSGMDGYDSAWGVKGGGFGRKGMRDMTHRRPTLYNALLCTRTCNCTVHRRLNAFLLFLPKLVLLRNTESSIIVSQQLPIAKIAQLLLGWNNSIARKVYVKYSCSYR